MRTDDGVDLEADLGMPAGGAAPWAAAVLAHPHPRYGGDMRAPVIQTLFDALPAAGMAALRFNFRGVGRSGGRHDDGRSERLDVAAAVAALAGEVGHGVPVVAAGWSFGADVSLCVTDERIAGWFCLAPVFGVVAVTDMGAAQDPRPKLLAIAEHDQYRPPDSAGSVTSDWKACRLEVVEGTDHFFVGRADRAAALLVDFSRSLSDPPR